MAYRSYTVGPMPGDPKECRARASRCAEIAAETNGPRVKQTFLDLAGQWTDLAIDLEAAYALGDWSPSSK